MALFGNKDTEIYDLKAEIATLKLQLEYLIDANVELKIALTTSNQNVETLTACLDELQRTSTAAVAELIDQRDKTRFHLQNVIEKAENAELLYKQMLSIHEKRS